MLLHSNWHITSNQKIWNNILSIAEGPSTELIPPQFCVSFMLRIVRPFTIGWRWVEYLSSWASWVWEDLPMFLLRSSTTPLTKRRAKHQSCKPLAKGWRALPAYSSQMTRTAFTFNSYGQSPCGIPFEEHRFASWNPRWCVTLLLDRIVFQTCLEKQICGGQFPEFPSCQNSPKALPSLLNSRFFEVGQCQSWEIRWSMMKRGYFFFQSSCSPSFLVQCWIKQWIWKLRDLEEHDAFNLLE